MSKLARQSWLAALLCAGLLILPFPIAGPVPYWRTFFSWIAFAPLLCSLLLPANRKHPRYVLRAALSSYLMGVVWYIGNCYWIYQTMLYYGGLPQWISVAILILYGFYLGLSFAVFGLCFAWMAKQLDRSAGNPYLVLAAAPFLWGRRGVTLGAGHPGSLGPTRLCPDR